MSEGVHSWKGAGRTGISWGFVSPHPLLHADVEERDFGCLARGPYWQIAVPALHVSPVLHVRVAIAPLPQHRTPVVPQG
jgi:hypothetical protein